MQKNIMQIKSELREADTFIFKDNNDKLLPTYPLFPLLIFSQDEQSHTYMSPSNTCQINDLSKDLDVNPFLNYFYKKFMKIRFISKIKKPLINKTKDNIFRNDFANNNDKEGNLLSIINLFNFNSEVNQNIDLSCGGFKSFDVVDVTCDDYLTKYFETLGNSQDYQHMLYHKNLNISRQNGRNVKLVTGLTNFCGETLRKMLLDKGYYLSVDGKIYKIQDDVRKLKLVKLLLLNVVRDSLYEEMNAFKINNEFMRLFGEVADNLLRSVFDDSGISKGIKSEYKQKNIEYNTENKRFEMEIEGRSYDATGWIYTKIEQMLVDKGVEGKYFFGNKPNNNWEKPLSDNLYNQIMSKTTETHSTELLKLIENTAKVFDYELKNGALDIIKFSHEEEEKLKKAFYDKTPLELFFKNPKKIADLNKTHADGTDWRYKDIAKYVLKNNIDNILTADGKEFFEKIKTYLSEKNLITQDLEAVFNKYKYRNDELENQNKKSKIEFSFMMALIECFQCGNDVAYDKFLECLSEYLNYFFYNQQNGLSKKESDTLYQTLQKEHQSLSNKMGHAKKGEKTQLKRQQAELEEKFVKLEIDEWEKNKSQTEEDILNFKPKFVGFDENIIDSVAKSKIEQFVKDNDLLWEDDKITNAWNEFRTYLANLGTKIDYELFCLYLNYYLQKKKIEDTKLMDGVEEDNENEDINAKLNFKIIGTLIEYKNQHKMESETSTLSNNFHNNKQIMDVFHLLEFFIYAAYMAANECDTKIKAEVASNVSDLQFFMYTNPDKLVNLITSGKRGVADTLLSFLLKNTGLETDKKVINGCKTKVCRLMERTVNVAHMTQLNLVKFDTTNNNRKCENLIMYRQNGVLDYCLAPLQTVDKINNSNILNTLLNPGLELVEANEKCDLILNPNSENSKLQKTTDVEALDYLSFDWKELIETSIDLLKNNSYLFWLCLRKKPELLLYNDENGKESNILFKLLKTLKPVNNRDNDFQVINNKYMPVIYCLLDMKDQKMSLASVSHLLKCMKVCSEAYLKQAASRPNEKLDQINFIELAFKAIEKMYFNVKHFPENHEQVVGLYKDILDSLNSLFTDELTKRAKKLDDLLSPEQQKQMFKYCYVLHEKISTDERYGQWIQSQEENLNWIGDDPIVNAENVQMDDFIKYLMENKFQNICLGFNVDNLVLTEDMSKKLKTIKALFEHLAAIKINQKGKEEQNNNVKHIKAFFESLKSLDKQDYEEQIKVWLSAGISENDIIQKLCLTVDDIDVNAESLEFFVEFIPNHPEIDLGTGAAKSLLCAINQMFKIINDENNQHNNDKAFLNMLKDNTSAVSDMAIKLVKQIYPKIRKYDNSIDKVKECLQALKWLSGIPDGASKIQTLLLSDDSNNIVQKLCLTAVGVDVNAGSLEFFVDFISHHPEIKLSFSVARKLLRAISRAYIIVNDNNHQYHNNEILVKLVRSNAESTFDFAMKLIGRMSVQLNNTSRLTSADQNEDRRYFKKMLEELDKIIQLQNSYDDNNDIEEKICQDYKDLLLWLYLLYKKAHGIDREFHERSPQQLNDNEIVLSEYKISNSIKQIMERNVFWKNCQIDDFINWLESSNNLNLSAIARSLLAKKDIKKQYLVYKILSMGDVEAFDKLLDEYPDELNKLLQEDWNCIYKLFTTQRNMLASQQKLGKLLSSMNKLIDAPNINIWPGEFQQYVRVVQSILESYGLNIIGFRYITNALKAIDKVRFNDDINFDFEHWNNADGLKSFFGECNQLIGYAEFASEYGHNEPKECLQKNKSLILKLYVLYKRCLHDKDYYEAHKNDQGFMERVANRPRLLSDYSVNDGVDQIKAKDVFYEDNHIDDFEKYLADNGFENIKKLVKNLPEKLEASRKNLREKLEKFVPKLQKENDQILKKEAVNTLKNIARYNKLGQKLNAVYIKRNKRKLMYSLKKRKAMKIIMNLGKKRRKNIYDILMPELKEREKNLMGVERERIEKFQESKQKQIKANVLKALNLNISKNKLLREKADEFYNKNLKQKTVKALKMDKRNRLIEQLNESESETKLNSLKQTQSSLNQANKNQSELLFQRKIEYTCLGLDIALIVLSIIFLKSIILIASTMALGVGLVAIGYFVYKNKEQYKETENEINNLYCKSPEGLQQEINDIEQSKDDISEQIEAIEKDSINLPKMNSNHTEAPKLTVKGDNSISGDIKI